MKEEEWKAWGLLEDDAMRQLSMAATDPRFPLIVTAGCKMRQQDAELTRLREAVGWAMSTFGNMHITKNGVPVSTVAAELRRRASGEGRGNEAENKRW